MTCKDCIHYCVCKDTVADENWTDEAPAELKKMFSPEGCENFTATADVAPVKHGEWEYYTIGVHSYRDCSVCRKTNPAGFITPYCPNCGARMDGGE